MGVRESDAPRRGNKSIALGIALGIVREAVRPERAKA
jgi:hypothetical protein